MTIFYFLSIFLALCLAVCVWKLILFIREGHTPLSRKPTDRFLHAIYCIIGDSGLHIGEEDIIMRDDAATLFKDILLLCNARMRILRNPSAAYSYNILIRVNDGEPLGSVSLRVTMGADGKSGGLFRQSQPISIRISSAKDAGTKWLEQFVHANVYDPSTVNPKKHRAMWVLDCSEWVLVSYGEWKAARTYRKGLTKPAVTYRDALTFAIKTACDHERQFHLVTAPETITQ